MENQIIPILALYNVVQLPALPTVTVTPTVVSAGFTTRLGHVDTEGTSHELLAVHTIHSVVGTACVPELNERKPSRPASVAVSDHTEGRNSRCITRSTAQSVPSCYIQMLRLDSSSSRPQTCQLCMYVHVRWLAHALGILCIIMGTSF